MKGLDDVVRLEHGLGVVVCLRRDQIDELCRGAKSTTSAAVVRACGAVGGGAMTRERAAPEQHATSRSQLSLVRVVPAGRNSFATFATELRGRLTSSAMSTSSQTGSAQTACDP